MVQFLNYICPVFVTFFLPPPQAIHPVMSMSVRKLKFETKPCVAVRPAEYKPYKPSNRHVSVNYSVGSNFFKNMAHRLPIFSNPVLRVFSKYILAVKADKSDEKLQRMEGFTSRSDSDINVVDLSNLAKWDVLTIHTRI